MSDQSRAAELLASAKGQFTWPEGAILYHLPPEKELLPERAQRLIWQCYLDLAGLPYTNKAMPNANYMSPTGSAPFLCLRLASQPVIFSEFESLVVFLESQHLGLQPELEPCEKADREAYISLIRTNFMPAEDYQTWVNAKNFNEHSSPAQGLGLAWPLNRAVPLLQRFSHLWNHWDLYHAREQAVLLDFEQACSALSERLGRKESFFGSGLTTLDAVTYGHLEAVVSLSLPSSELTQIALKFENLTEFRGALTCRRAGREETS